MQLMLSSLLCPTQLVATPTLLGRCGSCSLFFCPSLIPSSPPHSHAAAQDLCDLSAETCNRETTEGDFFFFFLFFALRPHSTGSFTQASDAAAARCTERHLSGPVAAGGAGIDPRQSKHSEGEEGPPPPLFNRPHLGRLFLAEGPKG